jgi:hypothetical protein
MWRVDELNGGKWSLTQEDSRGGHTGSPHMLLTKKKKKKNDPVGFPKPFSVAAGEAVLPQCRRFPQALLRRLSLLFSSFSFSQCLGSSILPQWAWPAAAQFSSAART